MKRIIVFLVSLSVFATGIAMYFYFSPDNLKNDVWGFLGRSVGLLLASTVLLSFIYEVWLRKIISAEFREEFKQIINPDSNRLGIKNIYKNKSEFPNLTNVLNKAKTEVSILGTSLIWTTQIKETIFRLIKKGISFNFLLLNPDSQQAKRFGNEINDDNFLQELSTSIHQLQQWKLQLDELNYKNKINIRLYDAAPFFGMYGIDSSTHNGRLYIVLRINSYQTENYPILVLEPKEEGIYSIYKHSFDYLWEHSEKKIL